MSKKIFVLLAVFSMIIALMAFVGCDNKDDGSSGDNLPSGDSVGDIDSGDSKPQDHTHTFSAEWSNDKEYHWQESTCGHDVVNGKAKHSFDENYKCEVCNYYSTNGFELELNSDGETYSIVGLEDGNDNTSIVIPSTYKGKPVTSISAKAFRDCVNLTSVAIPSEIKSIGSYAFDGCKGLKGVYITDMASWCGINFNGSKSNPLEYAKKLYLNNELVTNVVIPKEITSIDSYVFSNCVDITGLAVDPDNTVYKSQGNCIIEKQSNKLLLGCKNSEIPEYVTSIGDSAFADCKGLTDVNIPSNVVSIGYRAFYNCGDLTSVRLPSGITRIDEGAFKNCSSLTSIEIPVGIESIEREVFYGCKNLTSIEIPEGITKISSAAFAFCGNLTKVTIPNSVIEIEILAFVDCRALTVYSERESQPSGWISGWKGNNPVVWNSKSNEVAEDGYIYFVEENGIRYALKDGIAKIAAQSDLLSGEIAIPTSVSYKGINYNVTSIVDSAFLNCKNLTDITIPTSISTVGIYAFKGCSNLTVYCEATEKPSGWNSAWNDDDCAVVWGYKK